MTFVQPSETRSVLPVSVFVVTNPTDSAFPLERQNVILKRCAGCHSDSGIHSVQSRTLWIKQPPRAAGHQSEPFAWETDVTIARKAQQPEFKLLQRLWQDMRD